MNLPVWFALGVANPLMLWGLGAASIPIILHLLNKRRFRETQWAAMRFLLAAIRKNQRRIRLEQWLLLAVRTLLIVLVVAAMAKPFLESLGALPIMPGQRTHRVLVLDGSLSMAYAPGEVSRFDQAKTVALGLVKAARRGDALSVVLMGDPPRIVIRSPSPNHDEVGREISALELPHGGTDLAASFEAIDRVLGSSDLSQKEVVFLTDLQKASWQKSDDGPRRALERLRERKVNSVVIDLGGVTATNRAVTDLRLDPPIVTTRGMPPRLTAVVHNYGRTTSDQTRVRLLIDNHIGDQKVVDVPPGEEVPLVFSPAFSSPGEHLLEVQIDDDPLTLDNHRWLAVPVREALKVLLVDGDYKSEPFQAETDYLAQALNPTEGSAGAAPGLFQPDVVSESALARRDLAGYDAVVLCNIAQFTRNEVNLLDAYLKQGGGVVVFGGDRVLPENYNRLLYADGKGLLPAEVGPSVGNVAKKDESAFEFNPLGFRHPIVSAYLDAPDEVIAGLTQSKTWQFHKLKLPEGSSAQVALAFDNGDPAVVEAPRHRGRVVQVATSADAEWTSWPLHPSFPPVMEQIVLHAVAGRMSERNVKVGQPLDQALPPSGADAAVTVALPGGRSDEVRLKPDGDVSRLVFEETELSGPYQVRIGSPLNLDRTFAVNPPAAESDPAKLDRTGLQAALPGWSFAYFDNPQGVITHPDTIGRRGELHRYLLYGVLALLLVEALLAYLFGHHAARV